jgi:hypothetical protein
MITREKVGIQSSHIDGHMQFAICKSGGDKVAGATAQEPVLSGYGTEKDRLSRASMGQQEAWDNALLIVSAINAANTLYDTGYNGAEAIERLPEIVRELSNLKLQHDAGRETWGCVSALVRILTALKQEGPVDG